MSFLGFQTADLDGSRDTNLFLERGTVLNSPLNSQKEKLCLSEFALLLYCKGGAQRTC